MLRNMSLAIEQPQPVPLDADGDGVIRVRGTRITLDTVVEAFRHGATAEEITQQYPTLSLAESWTASGFRPDTSTRTFDVRSRSRSPA